jgi:hypothetical protein
MSDNNLRPQHQAATSELLRQLLNDDLDQHLTYEQLEDLLDGRLSPAEGATIEGHIAHCPACRADLVHLRGIAAQVGSDAEPAQVPLEETTTSGGPRVVSFDRRLSGTGTSSTAARQSTPGWTWSRTIAVAGAIAATVAFVLVLRSGSDRGTAPAGQAANNPAPGLPSTPPAPATADRLQDGSRVITVAADGSVGGLDDVPSSFKASITQALVAARLETDPALGEVIGSTGTLLGSRGVSSETAPQAPVGVAVESPRPTFRWSDTRGAQYQVSVFDRDYNPVAESVWLTTTQWTAPAALRRGQRYSWQIRVRSERHEIVVPTPPAPEARFRVISEADAQALAQLRERSPGSHLLLGVVYARLGLFDPAERELAAARMENPSSPRAEALAADLNRVRRR